MISLLKVVGLMSCGLLCPALAYTALAQADMEGGQSTGGKTIAGEVLRCEGSDCVIKGQDGNEVLLHIDLAALQEINSIAPGEHIEAMVNDQDQVQLFLSTPTGPNRRNDKE
jgi:hypothetical protein